MSDVQVWYEDLGSIGDGGWGVVRKMRRQSNGRIFAVKRINPMYCQDPNMLQRFALEEQLLWKVQGHPNIIRIIESHANMTDGKGPAIVFELMSGTLLDSMSRGMRVQDKITAARHLAEALIYAHSKGVIHRDVKPENVLVSPEGIFKLTDFGCSKAPGFGIDMTRFSIGTEQYMAPEQSGEKRYADERSDIHAYGVTLFHLFVGQMPQFNGAHQLLRWDGIASTDRRFIDFIIKMTCLNPDLRYQSMREVRDTLLTLEKAYALPGLKRPATPKPQVPSSGPGVGVS